MTPRTVHKFAQGPAGTRFALSPPREASALGSDRVPPVAGLGRSRVSAAGSPTLGVSIGLFCCAILLLVTACWQVTEPWLLLCGVLAAIAAEVLLLGFHVVNPLLVASAGYALIYVLPVWLDEYRCEPSTMELISLGLAALHLGGSLAYLVMTWINGSPRRHGRVVPFTIELLPIALIGSTLTALIIASWVANPLLLTEARGASQFSMSALDQLGALAAILLSPMSLLIVVHFCTQKNLTGHYLARHSHAGNVVLLLFMLSPVLYDLLTAGRSHAVSAILGWLIVYTVAVGRVPTLKALAVVAGLVLFSGVMLLMRSGTGVGIGGLLYAVGAVDEIPSTTLLTSAGRVGHQLRILEDMVGYSAVHGYEWGMSYVKTMLNVVPGLHLMYDRTFPLSVFYRARFVESASVGYDFAGVAEMYFQGGRLGVFASQFVLGGVLAWLCHSMHVKRRLGVVLLYVGLLFGATWWYRSDALNLMRHTESFFIMYVMYRIMCGLLLPVGRRGT